MSGRILRRRWMPFLALGLVASLLSPSSAIAITKSEVDRACAASSAALADYRAASASFDEAADEYEQASLEVDAVLYRQGRTAETLDLRRASMVEAEDRFQSQAIEAYMNGGGTPSTLFLTAGSIDQVMLTNEFLSATSTDERDAASDLAALQGELNVLSIQLTDLEAELRSVEAVRLDAKDKQEAAMLEDQLTWEKLDGNCRSAQKQYEIELARAAAARGSAAGGVSAAATPNFLCPFPGSSFTNSWGAPRSGGRGHQGTDMMGPYGAPLYASASGTLYTASSSLGGKTVWLIADYGTAYYYAHLSSYNLSSGTAVSRGDVVGYNGDSGNASGGAPHLHFEIHPNGRGSSAVNPYPTLVAACR
ncbi:MAG: M23 family metallopeptidase [Acidimicrobiia bacterium]|nr:M23 family metallopeptidase [Acidimicrobiia bacterium]